MKPIDIGDSLPELTLKNEKGEDVEISKLAAEKGVVLFLVPKADTRTFPLAVLCAIMLSDVCPTQPDALRKLAGSATATPTSPPPASTCTVSARIAPPRKRSGRRRFVLIAVLLLVMII